MDTLGSIRAEIGYLSRVSVGVCVSHAGNTEQATHRPGDPKCPRKKMGSLSCHKAQKSNPKGGLAWSCW